MLNIINKKIMQTTNNTTQEENELYRQQNLYEQLNIEQYMVIGGINTHLGICSAISSRLSDGLIGVFSNSRDGASVKWPVESLTHRNTFPPRRCLCRCSADFLRLFSCSRCRLCSRKKNMDILCGDCWVLRGEVGGGGGGDRYRAL